MPLNAQDIAELNYHTDVVLNYLIDVFTYTICVGKTMISTIYRAHY